jgi:hypothetical protein
MTIEDHVNKFGKEFTTYAVKNVQYWEDLKMYIGQALSGDEKHATDSTIGFEFYDSIGEDKCLAYKPLIHYQIKKEEW